MMGGVLRTGKRVRRIASTTFARSSQSTTPFWRIDMTLKAVFLWLQPSALTTCQDEEKQPEKKNDQFSSMFFAPQISSPEEALFTF